MPRSERRHYSDPVKYKAPYLLRNLEIKRPNQVFALDIRYIPLNRGYLYLLVIIDWKTRCVLGLEPVQYYGSCLGG
jgi:transposase InsO family protein